MPSRSPFSEALPLLFGLNRIACVVQSRHESPVVAQRRPICLFRTLRRCRSAHGSEPRYSPPISGSRNHLCPLTAQSSFLSKATKAREADFSSWGGRKCAAVPGGRGQCCVAVPGADCQAYRYPTEPIAVRGKRGPGVRTMESPQSGGRFTPLPRLARYASTGLDLAIWGEKHRLRRWGQDRRLYRISSSSRLIICCTFLIAPMSHGRSIESAMLAVL
jgi:hypothetical protein